MKKSLLTPLTLDFYLQPTLVVAKELIGKILIYKNHQAVITETEAYIGKDDPACHAARGKTPRTEVMFKRGGFSYVYFIYGMYHCLNIVTEAEDFPAAVLIRGILLLTNPYSHLNGPGKLCKFLDITKEQNNIDTLSSNDLFIAESDYQLTHEITPRIGIKVGTELPWRFIAKDFKFLSNRH